jgi:hypothetical protein
MGDAMPRFHQSRCWIGRWGRPLFFAYPNRVQLVAGEGRSYLLSLNAPAGTMTTEVNAAYKASIDLTEVKEPLCRELGKVIM